MFGQLPSYVYERVGGVSDVVGSKLRDSARDSALVCHTQVLCNRCLVCCMRFGPGRGIVCSVSSLAASLLLVGLEVENLMENVFCAFALVISIYIYIYIYIIYSSLYIY